MEKEKMKEDRAVQRWLNLRSNSEHTERIYLQAIWKYSKLFNIVPDSLIEKWTNVKYDLRLREEFLEEQRNQLDELQALMKKQEYSPLFINETLAAISSFFKTHRIPVAYTNYPKRTYIKYHNKDLTKEEIRTILEHSNLRERTFYLCMLESGLRPDTLIRLQYKHIKEDYKTNKVPMKIDTPREILKGKYYEGRFTFIGKEASDSLKEYLKTREPLDNEEYIFQHEKMKKIGRGKTKTKNLCHSAFSNLFGKTILKLGLAEKKLGKDTIVQNYDDGFKVERESSKPKEIRLYCLRKYFRNNCRCDPHYIQFWMGHSISDVDEHYISRDVGRHGEEYLKAYPNLTIYEQTVDIEKLERLEKENIGLTTVVAGLSQKVEKLSSRGTIKEFLLSSEGKELLVELFKETIPVELYPVIKQQTH